MRDFFKKHKVKILLILISLMFGSMLYSASVDGVGNIGGNLISMITKPFDQLTTMIGNGVDSFVGIFTDAQVYKDENETLKEEIDSLYEQLIKYEEIKNENETLKEIVDLKEINPTTTYYPAGIIDRAPNNIYGTFTIDIGSLHGVELNDPVISSRGLVGIISDVGITTCVVTTILNPSLNVGVYVPSTGDVGVINGDTQLSEEEKVSLSILVTESDIVSSALVVTSGASGIFPENIVVGIAREIEKQDSGVTLKAEVTPIEDILELQDVIVITDFAGQGDYTDKLN